VVPGSGQGEFMGCLFGEDSFVDLVLLGDGDWGGYVLDK
jgi:hypothetical protein